MKGFNSLPTQLNKNMLNEKQKTWVLNQLEENGSVSRNSALSNFISRLGALVCRLNKEGHNLKGRYIETNFGKDYIYKERKQEELL